MEPLVNISKEEFNSLMKDKGLDGTAEYVVERAKQNVNPNAPNFSFETLRDGTSPLIDFMSGDSNLDLDLNSDSYSSEPESDSKQEDEVISWVELG